MKKTIAVDMDEVLADLLSHWVEAINDHDGECLRKEDILDWDMTKFIKCGTEIYRHLTYDLFRNLPVIEDSQRVLKLLSDKYDVYIVSTATKHPDSLVAKLEWLKEHFSFISPDQIVLCGNKRIIQADIMIDDGIHNLDSFNGLGILFDAAHNRHDKKYKRVKGWGEIEELLIKKEN